MAEKPVDRTAGTAPLMDVDDYQLLTSTVRELVDLMRLGDLDRLEVTRGDMHILLCARPNHSVNHTPASETAHPPSIPSETSLEPPTEPGSHFITSPMVGTFYEAPSPGDSPFVRPGDTVEVGQTVAIIEAMKIMNEIVADRPGTIEEVLVSNGETVEYGHHLFRLKLSQ